MNEPTPTLEQQLLAKIERQHETILVLAVMVAITMTLLVCTVVFSL
jgi:type IV secretory pathway component VirB8